MCLGQNRHQRNRDGEDVWKKPNCKSSSKACHVDDFFVKHQETFESIKREIDGLGADVLTEELRQFSRVIGEAIADPSILLNYDRGCKLLADAIIAVDSEGYQNFATQNFKESRVLTKVLGQQCYYLPNNPEHAVSIVDDNLQGRTPHDVDF